jgi:hypothetical protein
LRRGAIIPAGMRAMALQGRQAPQPGGAVMPASPPGVLPPSGLGQAPRLPSQPIAPFIPATPPAITPAQPPTQGLDGDVESMRTAITLPNGAGGLVAQEVYTTVTRWRGIDVYIQPNPIGALAAVLGNSLGIQVYAISQGLRTLVGTGRYDATDAVDPTQPHSKWICSVRDAAERFDVQISANFVTAGEQVQVVTVATDEVVQTGGNHQNIGRIALGGANMVAANSATVAADIGAPYTVIGVIAATDNPDPNIYLQIYDRVGPPGAGQHPVWETPIVFNTFFASGISAEGEESGLSLHQYFDGIFVGLSSTPQTFTALAAGNSSIQVWYR